jgi:hypothetical protein
MGYHQEYQYIHNANSIRRGERERERKKERDKEAE